MIDLDEMTRRLEKANSEINRLCDGGKFTMSIPANPESDSDLVLGDGIRAGVALSEEIVRLRKNTLLFFGDGKIGVGTAGFPDEPCDREIIFWPSDEIHEIGENADVAGKTLDDLGVFLRFQFSKVESVQVVIDALESVKLSMQTDRKILDLHAGGEA